MRKLILLLFVTLACGLAWPGCTTISSPDRIIASVLDGLLLPKPRKGPSQTKPEVLTLNGKPVSTHNPRYVQVSPPDVPPETRPQPSKASPSQPLTHVSKDMPAPEPAPPPHPEVARLPVQTASERVLNRIIEMYRNFQYEEALQLSLDYVNSPVPSTEQHVAAAFIGASAAYVLNRPKIMNELLHLTIRIAPHLKPDPDKLPGPVCARHRELLHERRQ
jgi:hypothetical protein